MITTDKLDKYHRCIIDKLLRLKIDGCNLSFDNSCDDCNRDILYLSTVLDAWVYAEENDLTNEASRFESILQSKCEDCDQCGSEEISYEPLWSLQEEYDCRETE